MFLCVRCKRGRKIACVLGQVGKRSYSRGNNHVAGINISSISQLQVEALPIMCQRLDVGRINIRHCMFLEPAAIIEEEWQGDRSLLMRTNGGGILIQTIFAARIREARSTPE